MTLAHDQAVTPEYERYTEEEIAWARVYVDYGESLNKPIDERIRRIAQTPYSEAKDRRH